MRGCVLSGGAPTPLAHRCSKFHINIMGDGDRAYRIAGKFDGDLNLAVWWSGLKQPN